MFALAPGQTRGLKPAARAVVWFGFSLIAVACARPTPEQAANNADRHHGTHGFAWLAAHDPSALVAWGVSVDELRLIDPDAGVQAAHATGQCAQAAASHAALFVLVPAGLHAAERRSAALDCGVALYRDERVIVIAPR